MSLNLLRVIVRRADGHQFEHALMRNTLTSSFLRIRVLNYDGSWEDRMEPLPDLSPYVVSYQAAYAKVVLPSAPPTMDLRFDVGRDADRVVVDLWAVDTNPITKQQTMRRDSPGFDARFPSPPSYSIPVSLGRLNLFDMGVQPLDRLPKMPVTDLVLQPIYGLRAWRLQAAEDGSFYLKSMYHETEWMDPVQNADNGPPEIFLMKELRHVLDVQEFLTHACGQRYAEYRPATDSYICVGEDPSGIYAFKADQDGLATLGQELGPGQPLQGNARAALHPWIVGLIRLYGQVVEHQRGYRGEHAVVESLALWQRQNTNGDWYFCTNPIMNAVVNTHWHDRIAPSLARRYQTVVEPLDLLKERVLAIGRSSHEGL